VSQAAGAATAAARRREAILDAALRIFARKGYHQTGIADIASELGLGHGTFYRYFKNKHDIAVHVLDRVMMRIGEMARTEVPEASESLDEYRAQVHRLLARWLAFADEQPELLRLLHEQSVVIDLERLQRLVEGYVLFTMRFLHNGVAKRFLRADLDVRATAEMLVALILEGTRRALAAPDAEARRRWAAAGMALMFDGVRAPTPPLAA
jgi:AcrR family transcriptional regulator